MRPEFPVILFYKYVAIAAPEELREAQRELCQRLGLKGRILIAYEGINGTLAGPVGAIDAYVAELRADARFADLEVKTTPGDETTFPKLAVRVRPEIVTLGAGPLPADTHNHVSPTEWKRLIEEDPEIVLLDVRNTYETAAGRFEGAVACEIENFRDLPAYLPALEPLKDRKVLMYCTGGIRCEKASALLRREGFERVFQLHGGIAQYQEEYGNAHWLGECFVFDQRLSVRVEENLVPLGRCAHSGRPTGRSVNCRNLACDRLFLLAPETEAEEAEAKFCPQCRISARRVEERRRAQAEGRA